MEKQAAQNIMTAGYLAGYMEKSAGPMDWLGNKAVNAYQSVAAPANPVPKGMYAFANKQKQAGNFDAVTQQLKKNPFARTQGPVSTPSTLSAALTSSAKSAMRPIVSGLKKAEDVISQKGANVYDGMADIGDKLRGKASKGKSFADYIKR